MQPGSQSHNILALLDEAAAEGRSLPDLYSALAERGVTNNKASVRSVVWTLKNAKKVVPHGDRYYAAAHAPRA